MKSLRVSLVAAGYLGSAWVGGLGIVTLACGLAWSAAPESHPQDPGGAPPPEAVGHDFTFKPVIPVDVEDGTGDFSFIHNPDKIPEAQRIFDRFAWRVFVGFNWPSNADGLPDPKITLRQDAEEGSWRPRVWQALADVNELYKQFGAAPEPWNGGAFPGFDPGKIEPDTLWMYSKISNRHALNRTQILDESKQAFTGPLVDQQGKWVRYQIRLNRTAYEYVRQNGLYSLEGQAEFSRANTLRFPRNGDKIGDKTFEFGTTELKFAWKQLADYDEKTYGPFKAGDYDLTTPERVQDAGRSDGLEQRPVPVPCPLVADHPQRRHSRERKAAARPSPGADGAGGNAHLREDEVVAAVDLDHVRAGRQCPGRRPRARQGQWQGAAAPPDVQQPRPADQAAQRPGPDELEARRFRPIHRLGRGSDDRPGAGDARDPDPPGDPAGEPGRAAARSPRTRACSGSTS